MLQAKNNGHVYSYADFSLQAIIECACGLLQKSHACSDCWMKTYYAKQSMNIPTDQGNVSTQLDNSRQRVITNSWQYVLITTLIT